MDAINVNGEHIERTMKWKFKCLLQQQQRKSHSNATNIFAKSSMSFESFHQIDEVSRVQFY